MGPGCVSRDRPARNAARLTAAIAVWSDREHLEARNTPSPPCFRPQEIRHGPCPAVSPLTATTRTLTEPTRTNRSAEFRPQVVQPQVQLGGYQDESPQDGLHIRSDARRRPVRDDARHVRRPDRVQIGGNGYGYNNGGYRGPAGHGHAGHGPGGSGFRSSNYGFHGGRYDGSSGHQHSSGYRGTSGGYRQGSGHYDYHPTSVVPHGSHFDVRPGHYDYHRGGHYGH